MRILILVSTLGVACKGQAELVTSDCGGADCPVCEADSECVVLHNPCHATATCAHVDEPLGVTQEGCSAALEYETPPASDCTCEAERCTAVATAGARPAARGPSGSGP